jgi:predicted NAD/FAD-binding protein
MHGMGQRIAIVGTGISGLGAAWALYREGFLEDYLYPMTGAIWSAPQSDISGFPAASILRFLTNHGLMRSWGGLAGER